jgi:hypothetical protein
VRKPVTSRRSTEASVDQFEPVVRERSEEVAEDALELVGGELERMVADEVLLVHGDLVLLYAQALSQAVPATRAGSGGLALPLKLAARRRRRSAAPGRE